MFYPIPIVIYILEIACVAVFLKARPVTRILIAAILIISTAGVFEWMIRND